MEHMEPPEPLPVVSSEDGVSRHNTSTSSDEQNHMIAISPTIFDSSFYDESTHTEFDSLPKEVDPLSVFLAEIGNDFEDDINFGAGNTVAEV